MPDSTLSAAIKEAYATAPAGEVILHTLEFRHQNFTTPIRVVRDFNDLTATLESTAPLNPSAAVTFIAFNFEFQLPEVQHSAVPEIIISIDNVSPEIEQNLAIAVASPYPIYVTYRPFLSTDLSAPQMNPPLTLTVTHIEATDFRVTARATFGDMSNRQFPNKDYTVAGFPGLGR
jgi:hypothetical protein